MSVAADMLKFTPAEAIVLVATPGVAVLVIYEELGETWAKLYLHGELDGEVERKTLDLARHEVTKRGHVLARMAVLRATPVASGNQ